MQEYYKEISNHAPFSIGGSFCSHPIFSIFVLDFEKIPSFLSFNKNTFFKKDNLLTHFKTTFKDLKIIHKDNYFANNTAGTKEKIEIYQSKKQKIIFILKETVEDNRIEYNKESEEKQDNNIILCNLYILYCIDDIEFIKKLEEDINDFIYKNEAVNVNNINFIMQVNNTMYLQKFTIKNKNIDINLCYNDSLIEKNESIIEKLNKKNSKGILMFYGLPGGGKTTYIKYLTSKVDKKIIYVPTSLTNIISDPSFLKFISQHPNSILIIEDAENVVKTREIHNSACISNILNLTDGILSEALNIQIICTFNTKIDKIDPALLRKGRLIADIEFKALNIEKAKKLAKSIGVDQNIINTIEKDMPLCDIYGLLDEFYFSESKESDNKKKIGF